MQRDAWRLWLRRSARGDESSPERTEGRAHSRLGSAESRFGFLLIVPALLLFSTVILYPFLDALVRSLYKDDLFTVRPIFIGLDNFRRILGDGLFIETWWTTLIFVTATSTLTMILGLAWALVLNQPIFARDLLRSLTLLPWIFPGVVIAFLWSWMFNSQYGIINAVLLQANLIPEQISWLSSGHGAMAAVVIARSWATMPLVMAFYLAALQTLPQEQLDASRVDGAGDGAVIRHIVLPHLRYITVILLILQAIGNLQQFDIIYAMTAGGPVRATTVFSLEVYRQAFGNWDMGLASAIGVLWLITIAIPSYFYLRTIFGESRA